jgi:hypothetical protein
MSTRPDPFEPGSNVLAVAHVTVMMVGLTGLPRSRFAGKINSLWIFLAC